MAGGGWITRRGPIAAAAVLAVLGTRAADIATTLHFNPSLSNEANPLTFVIGTDALVFVAVNIGSVFLLLCLPMLLYWRWPTKKLAAPPASVWEFAALCIYDRPMSRGQFLRAFLLCWPLPSDWRQTARLLVFAAAWAVACAGAMAVLSWWAINEWDWSAYHAVRSALVVAGYPVLELLVGMVALVAATVFFFRSEHAQAMSAFSIDRSAS